MVNIRGRGGKKLKQRYWLTIFEQVLLVLLRFSVAFGADLQQQNASKPAEIPQKVTKSTSPVASP